MGFYDSRIKHLYETCPRLVIMSINSIFKRNHPLDEEIDYLDKEQTGEADENETFMDMLIRVENCKYHFEFQLLEDNMAIRMYEYSVKETIREIEHSTNLDDLHDRYEIEIIMPMQAVIFLAGGNRKNEITVRMTLPDGQKVRYSLPCISASVTVDELVQRKLFLLIPFQQVQLNHRMNRISECKVSAKHQIALEMYEYHKAVKNSLENLVGDGIITADEFHKLIVTLSDLENYLAEKDEEVKKEVKQMGDKDYVCWSERIEASAKAEGIAEGKAEGKAESILELLEDFEEDIPSNIRSRIMEQKDTAILKKWHKAAAKAESMGEFEKVLEE